MAQVLAMNAALSPGVAQGIVSFSPVAGSQNQTNRLKPWQRAKSMHMQGSTRGKAAEVSCRTTGSIRHAESKLKRPLLVRLPDQRRWVSTHAQRSAAGREEGGELAGVGKTKTEKAPAPETPSQAPAASGAAATSTSSAEPAAAASEREAQQGPTSPLQLPSTSRGQAAGGAGAGEAAPFTTQSFWANVWAETQLIEWPQFSKALGTTGVVVGIILGSSVLLLALNGVLSELSDQVFTNSAVASFWSGKS